jgi:hypothetical protein
MEDTNWAERVVGWVRRKPLVVFLLFAALLASSIASLVDYGMRATDTIQDALRMKQREYDLLTDLKAGFTIQKFEETLGAPIFRRPLDDRRWTESTFQGDSYWVQAVSDRDGVVALYSVTSCDTGFAPTFDFPGGTVTLNVSTMASVGSPIGAAEARYFLSGATANSNFVDIAYGGNPGNYKTYAWGINDACFSWQRYSRDLFRAGVLPFSDTTHEFSGSPGRGGTSLLRFRHRAVVNLYAETAPFIELDDLGNSQIGVDRLLVRTMPDWATVGGSPPEIASLPVDHHFLEPTHKCLQATLPSSAFFWKGYEPRDAEKNAVIDVVHPSAGGAEEGFLVIEWIDGVQRSRRLTITFESSPEDARREAVSADRFEWAPVSRVQRVGNALVLWRPPAPSQAEASQLRQCLSSTPG